MPRFEGGIKRDIAPIEQFGDEGLSDEQKQAGRLDQFEAGRAKAWTSHEGFRGMEAEANEEKDSAGRERERALERLEEYEKKLKRFVRKFPRRKTIGSVG